MASKTPIYQDVDSWWARRRGVYVKDIRKEGIDVVSEACGIALLVLYELHGSKRTFNHDGEVIPMSKSLAARRIRYLIALSKRHGASATARAKIRRLVEYIISHDFKMPKKAVKMALKAIKNYRRLKKRIVKKCAA